MAPAAVDLAAFAGLARHVSIVILTPTGVVLAATEAAERALGCRGPALVGRPWAEVCLDPRSQTQAYVAQCARTLAPIPGAFRRDLDGSARRFRCEGYATQLADGTRVILLQIRAQDQRDNFVLLGQKLAELNNEVLRRKESELKLAEAVERETQAQVHLKAILDQMPAGVVIVEAPSGKVIYSNQTAREIVGGPIEVDSLGEYGATFMAWHEDGRSYAPEEFPIARALSGEVVIGEDVHFRKTDGTRAVARTNAGPIRDERGAVVAAVNTFDDITSQKQLEQATQAARAEAELASRAKDEFLAMLGHELRNPLAPILTALHLMRLRGTGAERERSVIERQVSHLVRLVDDLLDISRITSGKIELQRERIELAAVVTRAIEMASPLLEKRAHNLSVSVPHAGLVIDGDPARLAQVVSNLLTNAAKYSEPSSQIWVTATRDEDVVVLRVRDAGIGIAPEILPKIFDRFVQERQALDRSQGGLGLGLAIVRSLVTLHGGTVAAHSDGKGRGSELTIRLPAIRDRTLSPSDPMLVLPLVAAPTQTGLRVLVVDDNLDGADMLSETLEAMGHATRVAHDGPAALRMARDFAPHLALLDIGLPVMDGYELAQRLRQEPGLQRIRLVAITGYGQQSDRKRSQGAGFDAHLVKPISVEALRSAIQKEGLA